MKIRNINKKKKNQKKKHTVGTIPNFNCKLQKLSQSR